MAYSALEIAKYIISYEHKKGREISNLRLQKLLYFVQAKVLVETGKPCFDDIIEAWEYGPVVPSVYHEYKIFGSWDIKQIEPYDNIIDNNTCNYIDSMLDFCKDYPTYQLVEITHNQNPWKQVYSKYYRAEISQISIIKYFKSINNERG